MLNRWYRFMQRYCPCRARNLKKTVRERNTSVQGITYTVNGPYMIRRPAKEITKQCRICHRLHYMTAVNGMVILEKNDA